MFLIESNQAYGSMVSCFFLQSDCSLARLVHVCLLQSLWWTSAVSRPSALTETKRCEPILRILWSVLILDERKEGEGLAPWSLSCLRMFTGAISGRSLWQGNLVSFYLTSLFDACCEGWGLEKILLRF